MNETYMTPASPAGAMTTERTPEVVGAEVRNLTAAAKYLTVWYAVEIGRRLTEAKELVAHGEWLDWLKRETEFSQPTANRFMRIYAEYGSDQGNLFGAETKYSTLNNLSVSNALRLLAVPEEERESFALEVDAEHLSSRELEQAIRERDEAKKALQNTEARLKDTQKTLSDSDKQITDLRQRLKAAQEDVRAADDQATENERALKARIQELEARPVEVAVQEPDTAEIEKRAAELAKAADEARAAAEAKAKEAEEKAAAERNELQEKLKAAEAKLAAAGAEDKAEAEQLRGTVEELQKRLILSGGDMVTFRLRFQEWQESYAAMQTTLVAVPEEQREKCAAAVKAVLAGWSA